MYLDAFEARWRQFLQRQMHQAHVLVVDDEPNVGRFLQYALKDSGYTVTVTRSVADAWPRIESEDIDLIVVDKTMPEEGGLALLERLRDSHHDIPAVLLTGEVSPSAIGEALSSGAADYLAKPIVNKAHLVRRLRSVLDRRLTRLFFDVMFSDLSKALMAGTGSSKKFTTLSRSVVQLKEELGKQPACVLVDDQVSRRESRVVAIHKGGVLARGIAPDGLAPLMAEPYPPLVAAFSLECASACEQILEQQSKHPELLSIALADTGSVRDALRAVETGASDYTLVRHEGIDICVRRIERLVAQARRHALYLGIAKLLHAAAREARPDLAEDIIFALGER